jgi:hypothetical protein
LRKHSDCDFRHAFVKDFEAAMNAASVCRKFETSRRLNLFGGHLFVLGADRFTLGRWRVNAPFWRTFCAILAHIPSNCRFTDSQHLRGLSLTQPTYAFLDWLRELLCSLDQDR